MSLTKVGIADPGGFGLDPEPDLTSGRNMELDPDPTFEKMWIRIRPSKNNPDHT